MRHIAAFSAELRKRAAPPANISIVKKIAKALKVGHEYLLDDAAQYVIDAAARGGENAAHDVDRLLSDIQVLFAGGELTPQDKG